LPDCQYYFDPFLNVVQKSGKVRRFERKVTITFMSFMDTDDKHINDISAT